MMQATYSTDEIKRMIPSLGLRELRILDGLIIEEQACYNDADFLYIDSLIMQRANHLHYILVNPWWFWLHE